MGMVVQHNMNALNAYNKLNTNVAGLKKSSEKLSSGYRINRAGDDAAGLAISEKMRSQIRGLGQAKRNSQDGISMIQTFEGAAQESHSILQRMKELASESSNGTYDNSTDRAAIQLEFNQLNDELNQIADTDFNGTVVLNGGQMADGLKENGGVFNYKDRTAAETAAAAKDAEALKKAKDFNDDPDGVGKIVDNSKYTKKADADAIWTKLGIDLKSTDIKNPDELTITFTNDGDIWKATGVVDKDGKKVDVSQAALDKLTTTKTANGGFSIDGTSLNLVFNTNNAGKYVQASITVQNANVKNSAPTNVGVMENTFKTNITAGDKPTAPTVVLNTTNVTDDKMTADLKAALDALKGNKITLTYAAGAATGYTLATADVNADAANGVTGGKLAIANDGKITYTVTGGAALELGTITAGAGDGAKTAGTVEFELNFDSYNFVDPSKLTAKTVATPDANKATAGMFNVTKDGVSKADSFSNSTAIMTYTNNITLQTGARTKDSVNFTFEYNKDGTADMGNLKANLNISARADGLNTENLSLATQDDANAAMDQIDKAINKVSMVRASFGSIQNRLEHKIENLTTTNENLTDAESSIRDTDMASEMLNYTKYNILQQAAQSMLAQANQQPQSILQLLG